MMTIDDMLRAWRMESKSLRVPKSYDSLIQYFSQAEPDCDAHDVLEHLLQENLIEMTVRGEYMLTPKGVQHRMQLDDGEILEAGNQEPGSPLEWARFKKLLGYFIDCVRIQEKEQQYLEPSDFKRRCFLPNLGYGWLPEGEREKDVVITPSSLTRSIINSLLVGSQQGKKNYIGYPLMAFKGKDGKKILYTPLALIPVEISSTALTGEVKLRLRLDDVGLNTAWMEYYVSKHEQDVFVRSIYRDSGDSGFIDLRAILPRLELQSGVPENTLQPDGLDMSLPSNIPGKSSLLNIAVCFSGSSPIYSGNLIRELEYIREQPWEILEQTALAYVFRENPRRWRQPDISRLSLPFIDVNDEQRLAVEQALNQPITRVTGPPGTGKSQVAVNLIANIICRDRSVLFTSRNHKAVEAILERSQGIVGSGRINLVNFGNLRDVNEENAWYRQDISSHAADSAQLYFPGGALHREWIEQQEKTLGGLAEQAAQREMIERDLAFIGMQIDLERERHRIQFDDLALPSSTEASAKLLDCLAALAPPPEIAWNPRSILHLLRWRWTKSQRETKVEWLKKHFPSFLCDSEPYEKKKAKAERYHQHCLVYLQLQEKYAKQCELASQLPAVSSVMPEFHRSQHLLREHMRGAMEYRYAKWGKVFMDEAKMDQIASVMRLFNNHKNPFFFRSLDAEQQDKCYDDFLLFTHLCPGWAVTLLSLTKAAPCMPAVFDHVIIDEASQCDVAPIIPALFRAKRVTFIGDPKQFPPVVSIGKFKNDFLKKKHGINDERDLRYDYCAATAYNIIRLPLPVMLCEHYRCHPDIVNFSNKAFYDRKLEVYTDIQRLKFPAGVGFKTARQWIDVHDSREIEIREAEKILQLLVKNKYVGTVGVITPSRESANILQERFQVFENQLTGFLVNTVNAFQGGERDLIIFVLGYTKDLNKGQRWYLEAKENRYIYNVACTRARACLIIIGDREQCLNSNVPVLRSLAEDLSGTEDTEGVFESPWEEKLYIALQNAGVEVRPQHRVSNRRLDLAYLDGEYKLDIEVDGVRYHASSDGSRKMSDYYRDFQLESLGWVVQRFWVYELQRDMENCVRTIKDRIQHRR